MPNHISDVTIFGLWGRRSPIRIPLGDRLHFIIGKNGTGKTTVINLIAAVLLADFERLDKIGFDKVVVNLKPSVGRRRQSIEVTKRPKEKLPYADIEFKIKVSSENEITFDLDAFAEEQAYRGAPQRYLRDRVYREKFLYVRHQLEEVANVTWLSVYRSAEDRERPDEKRYHSTVDQKLAQIKIELVKYFSKLKTIFDQKTTEFQRTSFLSLTRVDLEDELHDFIRRADINAEKVALEGIFKLLGVDEATYRSQLSELMQRFTIARRKYAEHVNMSLNELIHLLSAHRAHGLVELYERLQAQSADIFGPRQAFLDVINEFLQPRKMATLSPTNELIILAHPHGAPAREILLEELSSGEKQLLIILGQALLQEGKRAIYIADEPELSLHVEWQELLTTAIQKLNPNAQIIFATHSPDIVGRHADAVIDMEMVL